MSVPELFKHLRQRYSREQLLLVYCTVTGFVAGLAALLLKSTVFYIHHFIDTLPETPLKNYGRLLFPLGGILLTVAFIKVFIGKRFGKGSASVLKSIATNDSNVEPTTTYSHMVSSALTVGMGGSAGLESPIVVTGAAIGSNLGKLFGVGYRDKTILLACGAAAGIAAVFNAPIAGVMFALEVLLVDASMTLFLPLIISAVTGALLSKIILNENILFSLLVHQPFNYMNVPFYFGLAVVTGIVSVYYIRAFHFTERQLQRFGERTLLKAVTGGVLLGIMILLFPPLFGEGYPSILLLTGENINSLFSGSLFGKLTENMYVLVLIVFITAMLKVIAASLTIGSGGNGGNFAPSLFTGAFTGYAYSQGATLLTGISLPIANFTIVGMAGVLCGVMHAPLTAVFLIAEITGGYGLMLPLMIVSSITFVLVKRFEPYSLEKKELAQKGELLTEDRDKNILVLMEISEVIETDYLPVSYASSIRSFADLITRSQRNVFPVINEEGDYLGIITMDSVRKVMFELQDFQDMPAVELMSTEWATVQFTDSVEVIMKKFEETHYWNLPVIQEGKYIGFVSKSGVLNKYREQLRFTV